MKAITKKKSFWLYVVAMASMLLVYNDEQLGLGVYMGAMYVGNIWAVSIMYIASTALSGWSGVITSSIHVAVLLCVLALLRLTHKQMGKWWLIISCLLANIYMCITNAGSLSALFVCLLDVSVGVAFAFVSVYTYRAVFSRGLEYRPAIDELICIGGYYVVMCYAMSRVALGIYMPIMVIVPFAILLCSSVFGDMPALIVGVLSGIGAVCGCSSYMLMMLYTLMGLVVVVCSKLDRVISALCVVVVDILFAYISYVYGSFDIYVLLPTALSVVLYMAIPSKVLIGYRELYGSRAHYSNLGIVNRLRQDMAGRLYRLGDVFLAMRNTFVSMVSGDVAQEDARRALMITTRDKVCGDCKMRTHCWRNNIVDTEQSMQTLCEGALERGGATILDIPPHLTANCTRLSTLLSYTNSQAQSYNQYISRRHSSDSSKLLIGEQLGGVSKLFTQLAQDMRGKVTFNSVKEQEILTQLTFHGILTSDVVFIEAGSANIILTVGSGDIDRDNICRIVSGVVHKQLVVDKVESTNSSSWVNVYLSILPQYQLSYGLRNIPKCGSQVSGDSHSFVTIEGGKCMVSVCDGMGSGDSAEQVSSTAITLVENFYRAGFDNDIILSCVNQLMATYNSDVYTAVDICVVDLNSGLCDFIKLGASSGIVRNGQEVAIISGNSLPMGAVDSTITPTITKRALCSGDIVVLASDGVWDCYGDEGVLADIVASTVMTNPQTLADEIMDRALSRCNNKPADDMTVLVARLL